MERKTRIPITRLSRYYDDFDYEMELEMAREVIEDDAGFKIVLFRIDKTHSNTDIYDDIITELNTIHGEYIFDGSITNSCYEAYLFGIMENEYIKLIEYLKKDFVISKIFII